MNKRILIFIILLLICVGLIYFLNHKVDEIKSHPKAAPKSSMEANLPKEAKPQVEPGNQHDHVGDNHKNQDKPTGPKKVHTVFEEKIISGLKKWQLDDKTEFEVEELDRVTEKNAQGKEVEFSIIKVTSTAPNSPRMSFMARVDAKTGKIKTVWGRPQLHESDPAVKIKIPVPTAK